MFFITGFLWKHFFLLSGDSLLKRLIGWHGNTGSNYYCTQVDKLGHLNPFKHVSQVLLRLWKKQTVSTYKLTTQSNACNLLHFEFLDEPPWQLSAYLECSISITAWISLKCGRSSGACFQHRNINSYTSSGMPSGAGMRYPDSIISRARVFVIPKGQVWKSIDFANFGWWSRHQLMEVHIVRFEGRGMGTWILEPCLHWRIIIGLSVPCCNLFTIESSEGSLVIENSGNLRFFAFKTSLIGPSCCCCGVRRQLLFMI